jgi:hypothetical protein
MASQYVEFNRAFVNDGHLRQLWMSRKAGLAVYLPLILRAWGRANDSSFIRLSDLSRFSGVRENLAQSGAEVLRTQGILNSLCVPHKGVLEYSLDRARAFAAPRLSARVTGYGIANGVWARLSDGERFLLISLLCLLRGYSYSMDEWDELPQMTRYIVEEYASLVIVPSSWTDVEKERRDAKFIEGELEANDVMRFTRRCGSVSLSDLSHASGMHRSAVSRGVERLRERELLFTWWAEGKKWFLLPECPWGTLVTRLPLTAQVGN